MFRYFFDNTYEDHLGEGSFGYRHFIWIALTFILVFLLYFIFKKHKKSGLYFLIATSIFIFVFRVIKQIHRVNIGIEAPLNALPWHMCTVLSFLMPIVIIFNLKHLKTAVYSLGVMGGIITLAFGDYFYNTYLTIFDYEGMFTHSMLFILPIIDIAIGRFNFEFKKAYQCIIGILILLAWATLANDVIFAGEDTNYMYLKHNELPFEIPGIPFFAIYAVIFMIFFLSIFGFPILYRNIKKAFQHKLR